MSDNKEQITPEQEMQKAINALRLELPSEIVDDIQKKFHACRYALSVPAPLSDEQLQKEAERLYPEMNIGALKYKWKFEYNKQQREKQEAYLAAARKHSVTPVLSEQGIKESAKDTADKAMKAAYVYFKMCLNGKGIDFDHQQYSDFVKSYMSQFNRKEQDKRESV